MNLTQKMYIGPNNRRLGLMRNTIYESDIPGHVIAAIKEVPEIELLIVPVEELNMRIARAKRKGTPEYRACEVVAGLKG